ncbi:MAG: hypothetical protein LBK97_00280 [Prevotellaceae bacterium]|jgi:hypothetical protein|nr:hypothetical protein [Prevotellaceae bacterium]
MEREKITENKVIIENGNIKTISTEEAENSGGWLSVEEVDRLLTQSINNAFEIRNRYMEWDTGDIGHEIRKMGADINDLRVRSVNGY